MDLSDLDSLLNNLEMETQNCTNRWDISSFDFNLTENSTWDQYIQGPSSENSSLESQEILQDTNILEKNNNAEELPQENSGMKWSCSSTNIPSILSFGDPGSPIELRAVPAVKKTPKRSKTARSRAEFANREHVIAERKRRERVSENLFTLSGIVPGLKKRDKASVLTKTIEYIKQIQEKVKTLEEQVAAKDPIDEAELTSKQSKLVSVSSNDGQSPKIELKVSVNTYLIKIHCTQACKGTLVKALNVIENLHLKVVSANSTQFSERILDITITSKVEEGFQVAMNDLFKKLKSALE